MSNGTDGPVGGRAAIDPPGPVTAGSIGTWRLTYTAGGKGLAPGGRIRVSSECDSDWGTPQFVRPSAAEYMSIAAPGGARFSVRTDDVKTVSLTAVGRGLAPGEAVTLVYGDRSGGGPGSRAQSFREARHYFWVEVDHAGSGEWFKLEDSPHLEIVGGEPVRLVVSAPSSAAVGEPFRLLLKAEDEWGNPCGSYRGSVKLGGEGLGLPEPDVRFGQADGGSKWVDGVTVTTTGVLRITARDDEAGLSARSNPIVATETARDTALYWADPHGGQVALNSKIADFFRYARDVSGLHFVGYQRNDHSISHEDWIVQQRQERDFYEPGRFVPVPGFEWSGKTWMGGHHNVYFRRHDQPVRRSSHSGEQHPDDAGSDLEHVLDLHGAYRNADLVLTPHVGGEHADLTHHEPTLEPALEMTSTHGTFEWFQREALERRYRLGFLGGSDSHTGRPGDDRPGRQLRRYAKAGLTGIYARELTTAGFIEAMRARRVYATTGARIAVDVESPGGPMGAEYTTASLPAFSVAVAGTAGLESVEVFRGLERIYSHPIDAPGVAGRVRLLWSGASRMTSYSGVVWDGKLSISGGRIGGVEQIRFDSPRSSVHDRRADGLRWHAWGCGYPMGLVIDVEDGEDAVIDVALAARLITGPMYGAHGGEAPRRMSFAPGEEGSVSVAMADLAGGPVELDLGVLNRALQVSLAPEPGPETVEFTVTDHSPRPGVNPYWVRVRQNDMEMAWTSPLFVDYAPPAS